MTVTTLKGDTPKTDTQIQHAHAFYLILLRLDGKRSARNTESETELCRDDSSDVQTALRIVCRCGVSGASWGFLEAYQSVTAAG